MMTRMGDEAFAKPSLLPELDPGARADPRRPQRRRADQPADLGPHRCPDPAPTASTEQRNADIEAGAKRSPAEIRADLVASSDRLAAAVRGMPEEAWSARVDFRGRRILASDVLWLRAREVWIHAIDLDAGASFSRPAPADAARAAHRRRRDDGRTPGVPAAAARTHRRAADVGGGGAGTAALVVRGPAAELAAWLLGRSKGRALRTADGAEAACAAAMAVTSAAGTGPTSPRSAPSSRCPTGSRPRCSPRRPRRPPRGAAAGPDRVDATDVELVTIDPPGAKDLDQALGIVRARRRLPGALRHRRPRRRRRAGRARWTPRCAGAGRPCTCPTARCRCTRPCSPRTPRACCPTARVRPCCGGSTSTARGSRVPVEVRRAVVRSRARLDYAGVQATVDAGTHPSRRSRRSRRWARCAAPWRCAAGRSSWSCPSRRSCRDGATADGPSGSGSARPSRTGTRRSRCSPAPRRRGSCSTPGSACCAPCPPRSPRPSRQLRAVARGLGIDWPAARPRPSCCPRCPATPPPRWRCAGPPRRCCAAPATPRSTPPPVRRRPPTPATPGSARRTRTSRRRCGGSSTGSARRCASP